MHCFTTTFARTLAIFAITSLVGCDVDDVDDIDDIDDIELRDGPIAGIPTDYVGVKVLATLPMQPVTQFKPKPGYQPHPPTSDDWIWTLDPAGDPNMFLVDVNGVSPYSENLEIIIPQTVCEDFLEQHPYYVPVESSLSSCQQIEQGCCDRICYLWGAVAVEENGQNVVVPVDNDTFIEPGFEVETVWGSYVETGRLTWNPNLPNGGHSTRQTACGCECQLVEEDP